MDRFLDNYISTLTTRRRERVADLITEAIVARNQIDVISQKLADINAAIPIVMRSESVNTFINSSNIQLNLRDAARSMEELYSISNLVSLLLDSHAAVLGSDVKAIEDQLIALEKLANNYAFLLSDAASFNYAYLEPFSDDVGRDSFSFNIPDRDGGVFGPSQQAVVRSEEGVLAIPNDLTLTHGLSATVLKSNMSSFITLDTGLSHALSPISSTGWKVVVSTLNPITSALPEASGQAGAQLLLEFTLSQPAPSSEIKIVPFADMAMDILQVIIYSAQDSQGTVLLNETKTLDRVYTLHFPMQAVSKFTVLINQPIYNRIGQFTDTAQQNYQNLFDAVQLRRSLDQNFDIQRIQQIIRSLFFEEKNDQPSANVSFPIYDNRHQWGPLGWDKKFFGNMNNQITLQNLWSDNIDGWDKVMLNLYNTNPLFYRDIFLRTTVTDPLSVNITDTKTALNSVPTEEKVTSFNYEYNLGFKFIGIGSNAPDFKGVFVSRAIPAPGDIGEVKLKVEDTNYSVPNSSLTSIYVTSTEYSVSNASDPKEENDWIPILPVGTDIVIAERIFPDNSGRAFLRFPASRNSSLFMYKNGYDIKINGSFIYIVDAASQNITGITLPPGTFSFDDIITCDYIPAHDYSTINFKNSGFSDSPLVSAYDNTGSGEGFDNTGGRNAVDLRFNPFIDYDQVASSSYSVATGLHPYQPVVVRFDSGTIITNLTNYQNGSQTLLPQQGVGFTPPSTLLIPNDVVTDPITHDQITRLRLYQKYGTINTSEVSVTAVDATDGYYFIHSGNVLMFNRPITSAFRVYYQYLQNSVRVRVVLRVNTKNFVSPTVDAFHLKTKTRRADAGQENI